MKTDIVIAMMTLSVIPNSLATCIVAGATIDEERVLINVKPETTMVAAHFLRYGQLEYVS